MQPAQVAPVTVQLQPTMAARVQLVPPVPAVQATVRQQPTMVAQALQEAQLTLAQVLLVVQVRQALVAQAMVV